MIDNTERHAALKALESANTETDIWEFLPHPDGYVRVLAIEKLNRFASQQSIKLAAILINDNNEHVVEAASNLLSHIGGAESVAILFRALKSTQLERPCFIANALAQMGEAGFNSLKQCVLSENPNVRYYAARGIGSSNFNEASEILEHLVLTDHEKTTFDGLVSTAARKALKTLDRNKGNE
ncbi:HEAT repeat domain-containing protein [Undibacterium sp. Di24W]|uniref:HEAT repeat domain-containing protein n=1 Tax=Undibacterium sp. Di24W TaxID=3413033 RepID=UPI003BF2D8B4